MLVSSFILMIIINKSTETALYTIDTALHIIYVYIGALYRNDIFYGGAIYFYFILYILLFITNIITNYILLISYTSLVYVNPLICN